MNPYAADLAGQEAVPVLAATPATLEGLLDAMDAERVQQAPAPGKWSAREIVCHLADCEIVFAYRLRQTLAEAHHRIQPFDQDQFARSYAAYTASAALEVFRALRQWNLALVASLPAGAFAKTATHPERGEVSFQEQLETIAGHDRHHLRQLEGLAGRK